MLVLIYIQFILVSSDSFVEFLIRNGRRVLLKSFSNSSSIFTQDLNNK